MRAIMVVGTSSQAGKSFLVTALCRLLARKGWRICPFKGLATVRDAYVTPSGGEIGHAQAIQAWAAGVVPQIEMNPIVLQPEGDRTFHLTMRGHSAELIAEADWPQTTYATGWQTVKDSLKRLGEDFDLLVCEGHGSPAEVRLKDYDLANMKVAAHLNAPTILVVDMDRGGALAHVIGTLELLEPEERSLIKGIVLNRFLGQRSQIQAEIDWVQNRTGIPVIGVIPLMVPVNPGEPTLADLERSPKLSTTNLSIAVIRLPRISNFTDFDPLDAESSVSVNYVGLKDNLGYPDAVILPGSKAVIADLIALERTGMGDAIRNYAAAGGTVLGICGGFQLMGQMVADPEGVEGHEGRYKGLGLVPLKTVITGKKVARQRLATSKYPQMGLPVIGYEVHQGRSQLVRPNETSNEPGTYEAMFDDPNLGVVASSQLIWGTYLHGLFDNGPWRRTWLNRLRKQRGLNSLPTGIANYREQREVILDSLADTVDAYLDLAPLLKHLEI
ncbi:MAG: cobyric acid synthase CobQ [Leptolyngbyaceae bacterium]|nr:cobyric acid synthase CobQ [Leptolyngbyaceae bacterium]